jgi:septation ring formation regulator EzrA
LIGQQIDNLKTDNEKSKAFIDNIRQEYQNLIKQGFNLTEVGNQIRKNIDVMSSQIRNFEQLTSTGYYQEQINKMEAQLRGYDVEAAKGAGNFGREYNQFKPLIDLLRSFIRR